VELHVQCSVVIEATAPCHWFNY